MLCDALKEYVDENNKIDVKLVNYILYQNQVIINELRDKVVMLSKHVDVLNRLSATTCVDNHSNENTEAFSSSGKQIKPIEAKSKTLSKNPTNVNATYADVSRRIKSTELESNSTLPTNITKNKLRFNENSENNINNRTEENETWAQVTSRRKQRKPEVIGTKGVNGDKLKGVSKTISLHVCRLIPNAEEEDVIEYLKTTYPVLSCLKLNSRQPDIYSSFKVDIAEDNLEIVLNPTIWPAKARVRRFFANVRESPRANPSHRAS
ncbi:hypothetical protein C0J52_22293 [Blattella germanica]|nr:hypothetical protein C0J52_22293 [Blattella germanica]